MNILEMNMKCQFLNNFSVSLAKRAILAIVVTVALSCSEDDCGYTIASEPIESENCSVTNALNLSTGIDVNGNVIAPAFGAVDPFWKLLNQPPIYQGSIGNPCTNAAVGSFTGDVFSMNFNNEGPNSWVNQAGAATLAPFDLGPNGSFGCDNAFNSNNDRVPYVFERSFCVLQDTNVNFSFTYKGDDEIIFELINTSNNSVLTTSLLFIWPAPVQTWNETNLALPAGSYSIRAKLVNTFSWTLGFSLLGDFSTTNGDLAISNNVEGCCENNVISILNVLEIDCDNSFNNTTDVLGAFWTFNLLDNNTSAVIRTETTDANGNIFFSGLSDGTYTVQIVNQTGWSQTIPSQTVVISGNNIEIVEFYSCAN